MIGLLFAAGQLLAAERQRQRDARQMADSGEIKALAEWAAHLAGLAAERAGSR